MRESSREHKASLESAGNFQEKRWKEQARDSSRMGKSELIDTWGREANSTLEMLSMAMMCLATLHNQRDIKKQREGTLSEQKPH